MTIEIDWAGVFAEQWGRNHHVVINPDFLDLIREKMPAEAAMPSVFEVVFHTACTTTMMHELLEKNSKQGSNWEGISENIVVHAFQQSGSDRMPTAFVRMSLAQSLRGKEEWDFAKSPAIGWYEYLVKAGILTKTPDGKFKLDGDLQRVFGPTIVEKGYEWIEDGYMDKFLDEILEEGPILVP